MVVISTQRLKKILPFPDSQKVLCFAGAGIYSLQETLLLEASLCIALLSKPVLLLVRTKYIISCAFAEENMGP